jgi:spore germination protein
VANLIVDGRARNIIPETRIYEFIIQYYSKIIDPATPLFKYTDKNIEIGGTALFNGDKTVGYFEGILDKSSWTHNLDKSENEKI